MWVGPRVGLVSLRNRHRSRRLVWLQRAGHHERLSRPALRCAQADANRALARVRWRKVWHGSAGLSLTALSVRADDTVKVGRWERAHAHALVITITFSTSSSSSSSSALPARPSSRQVSESRITNPAELRIDFTESAYLPTELSRCHSWLTVSSPRGIGRVLVARLLQAACKQHRQRLRRQWRRLGKSNGSAA